MSVPKVTGASEQSAPPESAAGDGAAVVNDVAPAPAPSPFDGLVERLNEKRATLSTDIEVPRWDAMGMRVFVRYQPMSSSYSGAVHTEWEKTKQPDWTISARAQILAHYCVGVYAIDPNQPEIELSMRPGDPDGPMTRMDDQLGYTLGVPENPSATALQKQVAVCRKLYWTDDDISVAFVMLADWSAAAGEAIEKDLTTP